MLLLDISVLAFTYEIIVSKKKFKTKKSNRMKLKTENKIQQ